MNIKSKSNTLYSDIQTFSWALNPCLTLYIQIFRPFYGHYIQAQETLYPDILTPLETLSSFYLRLLSKHGWLLEITLSVQGAETSCLRVCTKRVCVCNKELNSCTVGVYNT